MNESWISRENSIEQVTKSNVAWLAEVASVLEAVARKYSTLTSDDVWNELKEWSVPVPAPTDPRAMGPVMKNGVKDGIIAATGDWIVSDTPATPRNHGRPQRVYRSLIY